MLLLAADEIGADIEKAIRRHGPDRIAVVMGATTSGIAEGEEAVAVAQVNRQLPKGFDVRVQELGSVSEALACALGLEGPAFTVSTACSSGSQALIAGRSLIEAGIADAAIVGGVDSLCRLTINGFHALSALSPDRCNPFSRNRNGTMIGEGAAVFLMDRHDAEIALLGTGSSIDSFSMTAPEPNGMGLQSAIHMALSDAHIRHRDVVYVQLHGTGTKQNDVAESKAIEGVFGRTVPCGSSKAQIGHTLGAAGAMAVAHCWLAARRSNATRLLPPHVWDGQAEDGLLAESLVPLGGSFSANVRRVFLANAVAFGGSNVAVIIGER
jgi:3-oxoacyl-[acyl-carrier-protein] synthase-1